MMTFAQARELRQRGHLIGNHTFSHANLAHIPSEFLRYEIAESNVVLEREIGERIEHFSYPHPCLDPQWNESTLFETNELAFKTAVLTQFGIVTKDSNTGIRYHSTFQIFHSGWKSRLIYSGKTFWLPLIRKLLRKPEPSDFISKVKRI
ncbi:MAG: polysaccharide deacetylase family protein [Planctomycetaceae bacterium]|nr:polysaccharide deacetylase family protein [Planctomycetaceae bacterium]